MSTQPFLPCKVMHFKVLIFGYGPLCGGVGFILSTKSSMHNDPKLRMVKQKDEKSWILEDIIDSQDQPWIAYL